MTGTRLPGPDQNRPDPGDSHDVRHAAIGTLQGFAAGLIVIPTGLVTAALLSRYLGPEEYGLLAVTVAILVWVEVVVVVGLNRTAVRLVAQSGDWRRPATKLVQAQLGLALAAALLLYVVSDPVASLMRTPELARYLRLASLDIPFFALAATHGALLIGKGRFGHRAVLTSVYWLSRMSLVLLVVALRPSVEAAILALIGASFATLVVARIFVRPPLWSRSSYPWRNIWSYAWPLFFFTIAASLFGGLDLLFVRALVPQPEAAGFFGAAKNLTILPATFTAALAPLLLAKLTELSERGELEAARAMARRALRLTLCMLPFAAMTVGAAGEVVTFVYGGPFAPAAPILAVLIFASVGGSLTALAAAMLIAAGRPGLTLLFTGPLAVLALVAFPLLIPRFGSIGAAAGTTTLTWLGTAVAVMLANERWHVLPLGRTIARCLVGCIPAFAIAALWPTPGAMLLVKLVVTSGVIVASLVATRELSRSDLDFVRGLLRRVPGDA